MGLLPTVVFGCLHCPRRRWMKSPARRTSGRCGRLLAALSARGHLLRVVATAARAAALAACARAAALPASARRSLGIRDGGRTRLAHALLAKALVLLVVLDAGPVVLGHLCLLCVSPM